jgi:HlyD family secretion protein
MTLSRRLMHVGLPLAAVALGIVALVLIATRSPETSAKAAVSPPPSAPAGRSNVAGAGLIEPATELIGIASPTAGVIGAVRVQAGARVKRGDVLFEVDTRGAKAQLGREIAAHASAERQLAEAEIEAKRTAKSLALYRAIGDARAMTDEELSSRRFAAEAAAASVSTRRAQVAESAAAIRSAQTTLDLLTVTSPVDATVLQVKARPGQFAPANTLEEPLVTLGETSPLHVRVDVDEADIARMKRGGAADIFTRGIIKQTSRARFVRVEPLVIPKQSLTNSASERVDTRVLQVIYALPQGQEGFYVGQQVDAFVEAVDKTK